MKTKILTQNEKSSCIEIEDKNYKVNLWVPKLYFKNGDELTDEGNSFIEEEIFKSKYYNIHTNVHTIVGNIMTNSKSKYLLNTQISYENKEKSEDIITWIDKNHVLDIFEEEHILVLNQEAISEVLKNIRENYQVEDSFNFKTIENDKLFELLHLDKEKILPKKQSVKTEDTKKIENETGNNNTINISDLDKIALKKIVSDIKVLPFEDDKKYGYEIYCDIKGKDIAKLDITEKINIPEKRLEDTFYLTKINFRDVSIFLYQSKKDSFSGFNMNIDNEEELNAIAETTNKLFFVEYIVETLKNSIESVYEKNNIDYSDEIQYANVFKQTLMVMEQSIASEAIEAATSDEIVDEYKYIKISGWHNGLLTFLGEIDEQFYEKVLKLSIDKGIPRISLTGRIPYINKINRLRNISEYMSKLVDLNNIIKEHLIPE